jgi:hypothetical protein
VSAPEHILHIDTSRNATHRTIDVDVRASQSFLVAVVVAIYHSLAEPHRIEALLKMRSVSEQPPPPDSLEAALIAALNPGPHAAPPAGLPL